MQIVVFQKQPRSFQIITDLLGLQTSLFFAVVQPRSYVDVGFIHNENIVL